MAPAPKPSAPPVMLTDVQLALIDQLAREERLARRYRKHLARARKIREELEAIFGGKTAAAHKASHRGFLRVVDVRDYPPLPAKSVEVVSFVEFPVWDF